MFSKLFNPLTTATSVGVAIRYLTTIVGSVLAILGVMGWLSPEQSAELERLVPELLGALGALAALAVSVYAVITKSSSDKAAEAAKQIDAKVPKHDPVVIKTPGDGPNIVVPPK